MHDDKGVANGVLVEIRNCNFCGGSFVNGFVKLKTRNSAYFKVGVGRDGFGRGR